MPDTERLAAGLPREVAEVLKVIDKEDRRIVFQHLLTPGKDFCFTARLINRKRWRPTVQQVIFYLNCEAKQFGYFSSPRYTDIAGFEGIAGYFRRLGYTFANDLARPFVTVLLDHYIENHCQLAAAIEYELKILYNCRKTREQLLNNPDKLTVLMAVSRLAGIKLVIPAELFTLIS